MRTQDDISLGILVNLKSTGIQTPTLTLPNLIKQNMDSISAPTSAGQKDENPEQASCVDVEAQLRAAFKVEQNETIAPKDEHAQPKEVSEANGNATPVVPTIGPLTNLAKESGPEVDGDLPGH